MTETTKGKTFRNELTKKEIENVIISVYTECMNVPPKQVTVQRIVNDCTNPYADVEIILRDSHFVDNLNKFVKFYAPYMIIDTPVIINKDGNMTLLGSVYRTRK